MVRCVKTVLMMVMIWSLAGCAVHKAMPISDDQANTSALSQALIHMHPAIGQQAAGTVAETAVIYARELAEKYRIAGSPRLHNLLVNLGIRERGLCFHWTDDLLKKLRSLALSEFDFISAVAHKNSDLMEHSSVVVVYRGQPFDSGLILDGWRYSGALYWTPVGQDRYQWSPRYPDNLTK